MSAGSSSPLLLQGIMLWVTPSFANPFKGLNTELCSMLVVSTWSPDLSNPLIARFRATVVDGVNMMRLGSTLLSKLASNRRVRSIKLLASRAEAWAALPGLPPVSLKYRVTASITRFGLGKDVAALSR
jgi:hypothetical protein